MNSEALVRVRALQHQAESLIIESDVELENANQLAKLVKAELKKAKDYRKDEIKQAHEIHKALLAEQKELTEPLKKAETIIKQAIGEYMMKLEEQKKAIEAEQAHEQELFGFTVTETKKAPELGGTHVRKVWKAKVIDDSKVPVMLGKTVLRPVDMKELNRIASVYKGEKEIPGVEFYQEESVVIK